MENKVEIKNITNRTVGITVEDLRLHRVLQPSQKIYLAKEVLQEALTYPGVMYLFQNKYLAMLDTDFALDEGVITEDQVVETKEGHVQTNVQDEKEIREIINNGSDLELKKLMADESPERKAVIADIAATCEGLTLSKIDVIKRLSDIDLSKVVR